MKNLNTHRKNLLNLIELVSEDKSNEAAAYLSVLQKRLEDMSKVKIESSLVNNRRNYYYLLNLDGDGVYCISRFIERIEEYVRLNDLIVIV